MATDTATATVPHPLQTTYWRRHQDPDARDEARAMGYVPRVPQDDAPEEGRE